MQKFIIYQLFVRNMGQRNWQPGGSLQENGCGKMSDITQNYLDNLVKNLNIGAIWYTGLIAHSTTSSFDGFDADNPTIVKGKAGSPYAIRDYYDIAPELAVKPSERMAEFKFLLERTHKARLKFIIDFVPNHVARSYYSATDNFTDSNFYPLDGQLVLPVHIPGADTYVENPAFATGNNCFSTQPSIYDWYDTIKLNYDNRNTWNKMLNILLFWAEQGVDGFRCDMVEMVSSDFFEWAIQQIKLLYPNCFFIAEVYDKYRYRQYLEAGFDYMYDKSGFYDALRSICAGHQPAAWLTDEWQFLGDIQPKMLNFLENHDEQRLASDFFLGDALHSFAPLAVSMLFNKAPFMIYSGQEYGEKGMQQEGYSGLDGRSSIFDYCSLSYYRNSTQLQAYLFDRYHHLTCLATSDLFAKGDCYDLMYANPLSAIFDPSALFTFMRGYKGQLALVVANFSSTRRVIKISIPEDAYLYFSSSRVASFEEYITVEPYDYTILTA